MELESMANDLVALLQTVFPTRAEAPGIILVGHSMVSTSSKPSLRACAKAHRARMPSETGRSSRFGSLQPDSRLGRRCSRCDSDRRRRRCVDLEDVTQASTLTSRLLTSRHRARSPFINVNADSGSAQSVRFSRSCDRLAVRRMQSQSSHLIYRVGH
jgi:hypothetical protein